jgi:hypothetical protein
MPRKNGSRGERVTLPAFYTFETDGMPKTSDLADIYEKMAEGSVKEIRMVKGKIDVTRVTELMTGFVLTRKRWRCLYTSRATWLKPKGNITITLKKETKKGEVALNEEKLLLVKSLTRHPRQCCDQRTHHNCGWCPGGERKRTGYEYPEKVPAQADGGEGSTLTANPLPELPTRD